MAGFNTLISTLVGVANNLTSSLQATVGWYKWNGSDSYSKATYDSVVNVTMVVEYSQKMFRRPGGDQVMQAGVLTYVGPLTARTPTVTGRRDPVDPRDKFLLPSGRYGWVIDAGLIPVNPSTNSPYAWQVVFGDAGTSL